MLSSECKSYALVADVGFEPTISVHTANLPVPNRLMKAAAIAKGFEPPTSSLHTHGFKTCALAL